MSLTAIILATQLSSAPSPNQNQLPEHVPRSNYELFLPGRSPKLNECELESDPIPDSQRSGARNGIPYSGKHANARTQYHRRIP